MRIIFINKPTFFSPMKERLFLNNELDKYEIEYWSTYFLYHNQDFYSKIFYNNYKKEREKSIILKTVKELINKSSELTTNDIVITSEVINYKNYEFFNLIYNKGVKIIYFYPENIPNIKLEKKYFKRVLNIFVSLKSLSGFYEKANNKIYTYLYRKKIENFYKNIKNSIFLVAGEKLEKEIKEKIKDNSNKIIPIMSRDLLKYRLTKVKVKDQIVFLDQNLPFHPDFKVQEVETVNSELYYKYLNKIFDEIEKKYKMNVIIAAHPSSDYNINLFNNRKVIKFNTIEEIKKSKYIIGHYSTSLGLATVEKKPMMLINMDFFPELVKSCVRTFEEEFGIKSINITENNIDIKFQKNKKFYDRYYNNFLYQGKEELVIPINKILNFIDKK